MPTSKDAGRELGTAVPLRGLLDACLLEGAEWRGKQDL